MSTTPRSVPQLSDAELAAWRGMLRVQAALLAEMDRELVAAHDLTVRAYEVLLHLEDAPRNRLRMTDLRRAALLSASGVSRLVDRLERGGLVRRERCSEDGRGYWTVLTAAGDRKLQEARATHLGGVRRLFLKHFDDEDLAVLAGYWERVMPGAAYSRGQGPASRRRP